MAKKTDRNASDPTDSPIEEQVREQTGRRQIRINVDERNMSTAYANGFRTNGTAEEVMLDFGMNVMQPVAKKAGPAEMTFTVNNRTVMNYYAAKRLAIALSQLVRRHEDQFGELELDVAKRRKNSL